jgi:hypothetical protein
MEVWFCAIAGTEAAALAACSVRTIARGGDWTYYISFPHATKSATLGIVSAIRRFSELPNHDADHHKGD